MDTARARQHARTPGSHLRLQAVMGGEAARPELEAYVRERFAAKHGASVRSFMPTLLSFRDAKANCVASPASAARTSRRYTSRATWIARSSAR
jgi:hypothetical protein